MSASSSRREPPARPEEIASRWRESETAEHYAAGRWRGGRSRERDPRLVRACLETLGARDATILDVPSGTGRLAGALSRFARRRTAVDVAREMLARDSSGDARIAADAARLPFMDASFDVVVSCRLLHHLGAADARRSVLAELLRVSRRFVVASYWDASSWHAWRRRVGLRADRGTRRAVARRELAADVEAAGGRVIAVRYSFRFVSQQAFVVIERRRSVDA